MTTERMTQARFVRDKNLQDLARGEITCNAEGTAWFIGCPGCGGAGNLRAHTVAEFEGLVTVSPSILCGCGAHYFVNESRIDWC